MKNTKNTRFTNKILLASGVGIIAILFLQTIIWIFQGTMAWSAIIYQLVFFVLVFSIKKLITYKFNTFLGKLIRITIFGIGIIAGAIYFIFHADWAAWLVTVYIFSLLILADRILSYNKRFWIRGGIHLLLAGLASFLVVGLVQIETGFSEEEFFGLVQAVIIAAIWLFLRTIDCLCNPDISETCSISSIQPKVILITSAFISSIFFIWIIIAYQNSFYSNEIPGLEAINQDSPIQCEQIPQSTQPYSGEDIRHQYISYLTNKTEKGILDFASLAVATSDEVWMIQFKQRLLEEVRQGLFTERAGSIKYGQYMAALRAYAYYKVLEKFPTMMNRSEADEITRWFQSINRRAWTVEWVDWLYSLAYAKLPGGLYENQESGAGLVAILEAFGLSDPALSKKNLDYLENNPRGWQTRFRNTDDAFIYQMEWLNNALFQSFIMDKVSLSNQLNSFNWLLAQTPPDGSIISYNHPYPLSILETAIWGSEYLEQPTYLWLAGRTLEYMQANDIPIDSQIPIAFTQSGNVASPAWGSCLIYAEAGLPNQIGPLAPDKIVLRDGWNPDSAFLLLNLRFTGWHRYKATNSIIQLSQAGNLIEENTRRDDLNWLPLGRQLFRDKRIPRENLNGLQVERRGLDEVVSLITGIGGVWAQNPPHYARVDEFYTGDESDQVTTTIENWNGWSHTRTINMIHEGPIVVIDRAFGPVQKSASIVWNIVGMEEISESNKITIREYPDPAEMIVLPLTGEAMDHNLQVTTHTDNTRTVTIQPERNGELGLVTIFLTRSWFGADASIVDSDQGKILQIIQGDKKIMLPVY